MKFRFINLLAVLLLVIPAHSKDPYPVNKNLDIQHYVFNLEVNDANDVLIGKSEITFRLSGNTPYFEIDLTGKKPDGTGMQVDFIGPETIVERYEHNGDKIRIYLRSKSDEARTIEVSYHGIPDDGFIIGRSKFGDRTFFGDNWPDRGHHWLAGVDHPSDKATVEFAITAPQHYSAVATGMLLEESIQPDKKKLTRWKETAPVAMKVMTAGIAEFAVLHTGVEQGVPTSIWVYPQNKAEGFADFQPEKKIIQYFMKSIGPFSFAKLAHVQSKTRWGGLENAGNIFYFENAVTGKGTIENLIAHETAHQWFGNAVTESDWHHVWLSEGFATYFTHLYNEGTYGQTARQKAMAADREKIMSHPLLVERPVVDTTLLDINQVLSIITYQKASFVLHMLRKEIGDDAFWSGIRSYYAAYQNRNALTADFRKYMENASGQDLGWFFKQWIFAPGAPELDVTWKYNKKSGAVDLRVRQNGSQIYTFNLNLGMGREGNKTLRITKKDEVFSIKMAESPVLVTLDPETDLLFKGKIASGRL